MTRHRIIIKPAACRGDGGRAISHIDPLLGDMAWNSTALALSIHGTALLWLKRLWEKDEAASLQRLESEVLPRKIGVRSAAHGRGLCASKWR
jgi:hypothetical protein